MAGRELKALFRAFRERDELAFRRAAQTIIEEEEAKQHLALARDLRRMLASGSDITVTETVQLPAPPTDRDGEWPLAEVRAPQRHLDDLVLPPAISDQLSQLASEVSRWTSLDDLHIPRRQRLLFHGPPGCGKTSAADALANELGWPLLLVRLDAVISSYLGETASNLRRVFDYASDGAWVVLFDEFDALGKSRDDVGEHGEVKRVVNAFLQMLDAFRGRSIMIAATNHEHLLDSALWRRFDEVLSFPRPTVRQLRTTLRRRLPPERRRDVNFDRAASQLRGLPHAAAEKAVWDALRSAVLDDRKAVEQADLERAIAGVRQRPW